MMVQTEENTKYCPHCYGKTTCDCVKCGRKVRYIDFGGTWHKYHESCTCKICGGTGSAPR
jgi:hypothetical protein